MENDADKAVPSEALLCRIEECYDCPRFEKHHVRHFLRPDGGWAYRCTKARRDILPEDGVSPPPGWCPLRHNTKHEPRAVASRTPCSCSDSRRLDFIEGRNLKVSGVEYPDGDVLVLSIDGHSASSGETLREAIDMAMNDKAHSCRVSEAKEA